MTDCLSRPKMMLGRVSNIGVNPDPDFGQNRDGHRCLPLVSLSAVRVDSHETYNRPQKGIEKRHRKEICMLRAVSSSRTW